MVLQRCSLARPPSRASAAVRQQARRGRGYESSPSPEARGVQPPIPVARQSEGISSQWLLSRSLCQYSLYLTSTLNTSLDESQPLAPCARCPREILKSRALLHE